MESTRPAEYDKDAKPFGQSGDAETTRILVELRKRGDQGLSNAEIDSMLNTASQWLIFWRMRRLLALELVRYDVQLFGEPGKYIITEKGLSATEKSPG